MLIRSQPLASDISKKLKLHHEDDFAAMSERNIKSQRIGRMFDDILNDSENRKTKLKTRLKWLWRHITNSFCDFKYTIRNRRVWRKTMRRLRPWEGFDGLLEVMLTHLHDYILYEEQCGHSTEEYRNQKIDSAKETIELLLRMKEPDNYSCQRRREVEAKYPKYLNLITEYESGGVSVSGDFVALGNGWVGEESGVDPRAGYFEFVDGRLKLATSPDQHKTDKLLSELREYHKELHTANIQAEADTDKDFERFGQLFKDTLYTWWD